MAKEIPFDPQPEVLDTDIQYLKGVGPKRAEVLKSAAGIYTYRDLLRYYPRRYLDRSTVTPVRDLREDGTVATVVGTVQSASTAGHGRKKRFEIRVRDASGGAMKAVWFQGIGWVQRVFERGQQVALHGKVSKYGSTFSMSHPDFDLLDSEGPALDTGRIIALYPGGAALEKAGLTSRTFRRLIYGLLKEHGLHLPEILPEWIREANGLMDGRVALRAIHFPKSIEERKRAEERLKFEELFFIQLLLARLRQNHVEVDGPTFGEPGDYVRRFIDEILPFEMTGAQKRAIRDVVDDTCSGHQMNRLVQGDVGSGKTVVAVAAMLQALDSGYQSAFMAPTEILAEQHYANLEEYLAPLGVEVRLLIGSQSAGERREALEGLASGEIPMVVGTHAVIQDQVAFERLGLAVIDEQHRFGVMQRAEIFEKGNHPHMLLMTATPIPRSLAMTLYGDLDVSIMDEMPAGRKPVTTRVLNETKRDQMYAFLGEKLEAGQQAYVVYPLVEESEKLDLKDAESGYEAIRQRFPDYEVELVHGRLKTDEKDAAMRRFKAGEAQILVSTTVIEVGVDVPQATVMIIEHAERFGLSQLHQLRGRVGRGSEQSYCLLMAGYKQSAEAKQRLQAMEETTDGFRISEIDLEIRGAGDFFGTRQSGMPDLKIANITEDVEILEAARASAFRLFDQDPKLSEEPHRYLADHFDRYYAKRSLGYARVG